MNVLITGANGFLAKELAEYFQQFEPESKLLLTNRTTLDPTKHENVESFFSSHHVDIVVHTAVKGGKRGQKDTAQVLEDNIKMFDNLSAFSDKYKLLFNFGSGAEFDRDCDIHRIEEEKVFEREPKDYYGLSKNIITKKILDINDNIFNIRLFGCFGTNEEEQRLFRATYNKIRNGENPVIHQDKEMDFIYSKDVGLLISHIIHNYDKDIPRDINACYQEKYNISDLIEQYKLLTNKDFYATIEEEEMAKSYSGCGDKFAALGIETFGITKGIQQCLKKWNKY